MNIINKLDFTKTHSSGFRILYAGKQTDSLSVSWLIHLHFIDYKENTVMSERKIMNNELVMMRKKGDAMACLCCVKRLIETTKTLNLLFWAKVYTHRQTLGTNHCCECA
jgi:hypothetical protein